METVATGGLEIAYERVGAGPLLVLVHGAAEDSRTWSRQLEVLADELTVVAWDEPGAGRSSDLPEGMTLAGFADGLAALVESLHLGPAHVAGVSWGGTIALELYRRHPGLVATLIMVDTYAGWKGSLPADEVHARAAGARRMLAAPPEDFDPTLPGLFAGDPPADVAPLLAAMAADVRPATLACELAIMTETDLRDVLPHIGVPTLLVWGDCDVRSPLTVARQFQEAIPDTRLVTITGAGHLSHLEQPEQVNRALRDFCRAHPPRASWPVPQHPLQGLDPTGGRRDADPMSSRRGAATNTEPAGGRARGWLWWLGIVLGCLLVAAGVAETVRLLRSGDGGFAFWFGTLVGGGALILVGTLLLPRKPAAGGVLTVVGCLAGLLPTMWTVVVPVLLLTLAIAAAQRANAASQRATTPG